MLVSEWPKFQQRMADSISNGSENEEVADQIMLSLNYEKLESRKRVTAEQVLLVAGIPFWSQA